MSKSKILMMILSIVVAAPVFAATCSVDIEGNDAMQFNLKEIVVSKSCTEFTVNLKHTGKLAKNIMGHNWVLTKTADMQAASTEGVAAGLANDFVKPADARVIAHTKVIGGGETDTVKFPVSGLNVGEAYTFFCSFPAHYALMKGTVKVTE